MELRLTAKYEGLAARRFDELELTLLELLRPAVEPVECSASAKSLLLCFRILSIPYSTPDGQPKTTIRHFKDQGGVFVVRPVDYGSFVSASKEECMDLLLDAVRHMAQDLKVMRRRIVGFDNDAVGRNLLNIVDRNRSSDADSAGPGLSSR